MQAVVWKIADILVMGLIAIVIGVLFPWWAGLAAFLIGLSFMIRPKASIVEPVWSRGNQEEEKTSQQSLRELTDWEVTHGPSAPGLANPSRQD